MITYDGKAYVELDEMLEILKDDNEKTKALQERIDKAIEFIETFNKTIKNDKRFGGDVDFMTIPKDLLKILEGSDKE